MDISAGLIAKGTLAASAVAGGSYLGYNNWDKITPFFTGLGKTTAPGSEAQATNDNTALNEKIKNLGIEGCELDNGGNFKVCSNLNEEKLKKINFSNKDGGDLTVTGTPNVDLKIEKVSEGDLFTGDLKFTFTSKGETDVEIKKSSDGDTTKITLKKDIPREFKIKGGENKIERAWDISALGAKVGLTSCQSSTSESTCAFGATTNIWKDEGDYIVDGKLPTDSGTDKKITFAPDAAGYFEGFKFTVSTDISLTEGTPKKATDGIKKLTASTKTYEIGVKDTDSGKKWFLIEKGA